jgi:hypothetical protein
LTPVDTRGQGRKGPAGVRENEKNPGIPGFCGIGTFRQSGTGQSVPPQKPTILLCWWHQLRISRGLLRALPRAARSRGPRGPALRSALATLTEAQDSPLLGKRTRFLVKLDSPEANLEGYHSFSDRTINPADERGIQFAPWEQISEDEVDVLVEAKLPVRRFGSWQGCRASSSSSCSRLSAPANWTRTSPGAGLRPVRVVRGSPPDRLRQQGKCPQADYLPNAR